MTDSANGHLDTVMDTLGLYGPLAKLNDTVMSWINTKQLSIRESNEDMTRLENDLYILGNGMIRSSSASSILENTSVNTTMQEFMEAVEDAFQEELDEQNSVEPLYNGPTTEDIANALSISVREKAKKILKEFKIENREIVEENIGEFIRRMEGRMGEMMQFVELNDINLENGKMTIKGLFPRKGACRFTTEIDLNSI